MKAITLDTNPVRWLACKALGRVRTPVFWSRMSNLRYRDIAEPELPGPGWVKLRTILGGICGTDIAAITQRTHPASILRPFSSFPLVLGHENVAVVDEVGPAVTNWETGMRVVVEPAISCVPRGIDPPCAACTQGLFSLCESFVGGGNLPGGTMIGLNAFTAGSWSPRFVAHESQLHPVPEGISDEQAVLVDPLACSLHAILRSVPPSGARVLVQGSGIIGLGVVLALRALGYENEIIALARHEFQAERLRSAGANRVVLNPRKRDREGLFDELAETLGTRRVSSIFGNHALLGGAERVFECTGSGLGLSDALKCAAARGTVVAAGTSQITFVDTTCLWFREVNLIGAYGRQIEQIDGASRHTYRIVMDLIARGQLPVDGLLTHTFAVSDYRRAFATLTGRSRTPVIKAAFRHDG